MTAPDSQNFDLIRLAEISRQLGQNKAFVQGGGGNTSVKDSNGKMWIKASGVELANVQAQDGFVCVDYTSICQKLATCENEAEYTSLIVSSIQSNGKEMKPLRPSIETGFHALLGPSVLHSHSVIANLLTCSHEGAAIYSNLLPEAIWVDYASPGLPVTHSVMHNIQPERSHEQVAIFLLQNHGIIVAAATPDAAWQAHEDANKKIRDHFNLDEIDLALPPMMLADKEHLLFPDQAVYLSSNDLRTSKAGHETQQAYNYLRCTMDSLGLHPHYLPPEEADFLLNMEAEKYRQKVTKA